MSGLRSTGPALTWSPFPPLTLILPPTLPLMLPPSQPPVLLLLLVVVLVWRCWAVRSGQPTPPPPTWVAAPATPCTAPPVFSAGGYHQHSRPGRAAALT